MDPERHTCTWKGQPVTLTVTEFLILQALAQRPGVVKSRNALMDAAYDDQVYVDDRTIDSHIKRRLRHDRNALRRRISIPRLLIPVHDRAGIRPQVPGSPRRSAACSHARRARRPT
jgi:hypothetical protein